MKSDYSLMSRGASALADASGYSVARCTLCDTLRRLSANDSFSKAGNISRRLGLWNDMATLYRITADCVVAVHFAFVAFVVCGLLLTIVGAVRRWRWVRNVWFRVTHLAAIGFVVAESLCGITCPLTVWEQRLRDLAGQASYRGDFIATWMHDVMFFDAEPWVFTLVYSLFGAAVVLTWILVPPQRRRIESPVQRVGCPPDSDPISR